MEKLTELTEEQKKYAIDLMVTLVVEELAKDINMDPTIILRDFIVSNTGQLLYDETSKLWWRGPSDIAELYKEEQRKTVTG